MRPVRRYCRCGTLLARDNAAGLCSVCQVKRHRDRAPEVPPEFWRTEAMAAALDSGDLGPVLRAYRYHPFHGQPLPQCILAGWLHVSQTTLSRIEHGHRRLAVGEIAGFARELGLSVALRWTPLHEAGEDADPLGRRSLLLGAGAGVAPGVSATVVPPARGPRRPEGFDELVAALVHRDVAPPVETPIDLAAWIRGAASAKRNLQACRYALTISELARLLSVCSTRADALDKDGALRLWAIRAHAYQTAAGVLLKLGHNGLAFIAATRSMESAECSQDQLVIASSARILAHAFLSGGHAREARMTATSAAARLDALDRTHQQRSVFGSLLLRGAMAAARDGDRSGALELLDEADDVAKSLGNDRNYRWTAFGPTNVVLHRVHVAVTFGDAGTALEHVRSIDVSRLAVVERRACLYIDAARALVQSDKYADACQMLAAAERLAPEELISRSSVRALISGMARSAPRSVQPTVRALAVRAGADL